VRYPEAGSGVTLSRQAKDLTPATNYKMISGCFSACRVLMTIKPQLPTWRPPYWGGIDAPPGKTSTDVMSTS